MQALRAQGVKRLAAVTRRPRDARKRSRLAGDAPRRWLVTGGAGFIGSHLLEALLRARPDASSASTTSPPGTAQSRRRARGGRRRRMGAASLHRGRHRRRRRAAARACEGVDLVLHQAALGSVPRSIEDPLATHRANVDGFLNMLVAARDAGVERFVYAASSSTYGDRPALPKVEDEIGRPLSPYAVTKYVERALRRRVRPLLRPGRRSGCATSTCSARRQDPERRLRGGDPALDRGDAGRRSRA